MLCPHCGYFSIAQRSACMRCGHALNRPAGSAQARPRHRVVMSAGFLRTVIYLGLVYSVYLLFFQLYTHYRSAEDERIAALLVYQQLSRRAQEMSAQLP